MRPGVEHIVFTLQDTIIIGSHFMSDVTFVRSMHAGLREHYWGKYGTNAEHHVASEVILNRILGFYYEIILRGEKEWSMGERRIQSYFSLHSSL